MNREEIFARDDWRCVYCGEHFAPALLTVDHVQPQVRGGDHSGGNVVTACATCNLRKGHRRLDEFLLDEPESLAHFRQYARHVWPRHLRTLDEALRAGQRRRAAAQDDPPSR
jgi:5-methylcytosine-specific restriction endonuclease McrA